MKIYNLAVEPKFLKADEKLDPNDPCKFSQVQPCPKWVHSGSNWDQLVFKLTGMMTKNGERETARAAMRNTFAEIKYIQLTKRNNSSAEEYSHIEMNPIKVIRSAVNNCIPLLLLHHVQRGGVLYKVPAPPQTQDRATHVAIKNIITAAKDKPRDTRIWVSLAREIISASENTGRAVEMKVDLHKECEENKAYASYRKW
ncbi:unnamed protein product [Protopolystoma xenopodis]|uniref:Small ribosomal subunit protein uS7 domain-containing protein n=1 Tax=Protopolystoma xenopodis TaxID=117903 RepID=A0A448WZL1_9PLAT|nr:unnamed protein product [Protopolystoma xenopodis]